jgi:membrane-associated phospholipid phosphatase
VRSGDGFRRRTAALPRALLLAAALGLGPGAAVAQTTAPVTLPDGWLAKAAASTSGAVSIEPSSADSAPSYDDYFHALGYSFSSGLFARDQAVPLAIGAAAALALRPLDRAASNHLRTDASVLNRAGAVAGSPITLGVLGGGLVIGSLRTDDATFRSYAFAFSQGLIVSESLAAAVKLCVPRERPDGTSRYSFPSSHAAGAFALAAVSSHYYGAKAGIPLYALASVVALSRVTYGKHFPTDVIVGATIGYLSGQAAIAGAEHVSPATTPAAREPGVRSFRVTLQF